MEQTITIRLLNPNVAGVFRELEKLQLIKIIKDSTLEVPVKLSEKYCGVFSKEDAIDLIII